MKDKVLEILQNECPDVDFTASEELVADGVLDSLTVTDIIVALTMEFGVRIPYEEVTEENFNSVDAICDMLTRLMA